VAFREVSVVQVKELRRWLKGEGERSIAQRVGIDRNTVRRYIAAAIELGVDRSGSEEQLGDELIGQVLERVRPHRPDGHGEAWRTLLAEEEAVEEWLKQDLTVTKIGISLTRRGVVVPHRTLACLGVERCGAGSGTG
jgi:transposase